MTLCQVLLDQQCLTSLGSKWKMPSCGWERGQQSFMADDLEPMIGPGLAQNQKLGHFHLIAVRHFTLHGQGAHMLVTSFAQCSQGLSLWHRCILVGAMIERVWKIVSENGKIWFPEFVDRDNMTFIKLSKWDRGFTAFVLGRSMDNRKGLGHGNNEYQNTYHL